MPDQNLSLGETDGMMKTQDNSQIQLTIQLEFVR